MRVLVCGGRDFSDRDLLNRELGSLHEDFGPITCIINGGAPGADSLSSYWAVEAGVSRAVYAADWRAHGKAAGPIRNAAMLSEGRPDMVVAFPGGRGTMDMLRKAVAAKVAILTPGWNPMPTMMKAG